MQVEQHAQLCAVSFATYQLIFRRAVDRWQHAVLLPEGSQWPEALASVEGQPDDRSPPSPAFQDLRFEQVADDVGEFQLFGQCGRQVYSAAVRCTPEGIGFDVCLRARGIDDVYAASTYRVTEAIRPAADGTAIVGAGLRLRGTDAAGETGTQLELLSSLTVQIGPRKQSTSPGVPIRGQTLRWLYHIELAASPMP